jgi:CRP-like cAMP-binding protein
VSLTAYSSELPARRRPTATASLPTCDLLAGLAPEHLRDLDLRIEKYNSGAELIQARDNNRTVRILLDGWACRHRELKDGGRQITAFLFPGDVGSIWTPLEGRADHGVRTLTACRVLVAHRDRLADLSRRNPVIGNRVRRAMAADLSILNNWLVNLGQRKAPERLAHLLCELGYRLELSADGAQMADPFIPLTQQELADALGMTSVHVNRVVQKLRGEGLLEIRKGALILRDIAKLAKFCDFDPDYLRRAA